MELEEADTTNTPSIQKLPGVLSQQWLFFDRQLSLQSPQHTPKFLSIFLLPRILARKVDINTSACQLRACLAQASHLVGAHQHVTHPCSVFQIFQMIELV